MGSIRKEYDCVGEPRTYAIRLGCEKAVYDFCSDYARDIGLSRSAAVRRLLLIGARCEAEHGGSLMPATYEALEFREKDK